MQPYFCISMNSLYFLHVTVYQKSLRYNKSMYLVLCEAILCFILFVNLLKPLVVVNFVKAVVRSLEMVAATCTFVVFVDN